MLCWGRKDDSNGRLGCNTLWHVKCTQGASEDKGSRFPCRCFACDTCHRITANQRCNIRCF